MTKRKKGAIAGPKVSTSSPWKNPLKAKPKKKESTKKDGE